MKKFNYFILALVSLTSAPLLAEKILGSITIEPGIDLTFEAAARDKIVPETFYLPENKTDVHIEVLATWSDEAPPGSIEGGHVAYLEVSALVENDQSKEKMVFELSPHLNLSDNLHYAQNIKLPGNAESTYTLVFEINPPAAGVLGIHADWVEAHGQAISEPTTVTFRSLNLEEVVRSRRR